MLIPVVLAGGQGVRLWPLSRAYRPKPFLDLLGEGSPIGRVLRGEPGWRAPVVVGRSAHRFLLAEAALQAGVSAHLLLEPEDRGVGNALVAGAYRAIEVDPEAVLVLRTADAPAPILASSLDSAVEQARRGSWVRLGEGAGLEVVSARELCRRARGWGEAIGDLVDQRTSDLDFERLPEPGWRALPRRERAALGAPDAQIDLPVTSAQLPSDLAGLYDGLPRDPQGNALAGDSVALHVQRSLILAQSRLVAAMGVSDLAIVETADAVLVAPLSVGAKLRELVQEIEAQGYPQAVAHRRVLRPWGSFLVLAEGPGFKVKRIEVKVGGALSLQRHQHRSEHWVVVRGTAQITRGDEHLTLGAHASTFIPKGCVHRLENGGEDPLEIIEIQTGERVDEHDIERFDDRYGR